MAIITLVAVMVTTLYCYGKALQLNFIDEALCYLGIYILAGLALVAVVLN